MARARLDRPWISAKENKRGVWWIWHRARGMFPDARQEPSPFFLHTDMATFSCTTTRKDALRKHQASRQQRKSVLEELGAHVGPNGNLLVGALPFEVFSEVLAKLQNGMSARKIDRGGTGGPAQKHQVLFCRKPIRKGTGIA